MSARRAGLSTTVAVNAPRSEGERIVDERVAIHGDPLVNVAGIAELWGALFSDAISPEDVCLAMILVKVQRERTQHHIDNLNDIEGYVDILRRFRTKESK